MEDLVLHHVEEEEQEMFPKARKALGAEQLSELGEAMAMRKKELMKQL